MKKMILLSIFVITSYGIHAQIGLLSTNNKSSKEKIVIDTLSYLLTNNLYGDVKSDLNIREPNFEALQYYVPDNLIKKQIDISNLKELMEEIKRKINTNEVSETDQKKSNEEKEFLRKQNDSLKKQSDSLSDMIAIKNNEYNQLLAIDKIKDSLANSLLVANYKLNYSNLKAFLDSLSTSIQKTKNRTYTNYLLARDYKSYLDSSKKFKDKNVFQLGIADVQMNLVDLYEEIKAHKSDLSLVAEKLENIPLKSAEKYSFIAKDSFLRQTWQTLTMDTQKLATKFKTDTSKLRLITDSYNNLIKEQIIEVPTNSATKTSDFGAFPQLTSVLGKREVIPQLQLYGSYNYENKTTSVEANIGLSFAASSNADSGNIHDIFIPTASKFLIYSNFNYSFWSTNQSTSNDKDSAKRLAIKLGFSFAGKNLVFDTTKKVNSINSTMLYAKGGLELGVLPKRFSIYANVNTVSLLDKIDDFKTATGINSKFFGYLDCGARFFLDPAPQAKVDLGLYIYSDINFIINGGDVKRVTHSNDLVIPSIQLGIVKRLGRL